MQHIRLNDPNILIRDESDFVVIEYVIPKLANSHEGGYKTLANFMHMLMAILIGASLSGDPTPAVGLHEDMQRRLAQVDSIIQAKQAAKNAAQVFLNVEIKVD